jgi:Tfp pilus assembly protein PilN
MRINLLPSDIRERQRVRRQTGAAVALGVVLLALVGGFWFLQQVKLNGLQDDLEAQEQVNAGLRARIEELRQFDELQQELIATRELLDQLLADEVRWSAVLRDVSLVIPGNVWLANLSGNLETADPAATGTGSPTGIIGQVSVNGFGLNHRAVALWLTRLEDVEAFANPWASNSQNTLIGATEVVQFSSTVDLSEVARGRGGEQG